MAEKGKRKRGSAVFQLAGMSTDIERRWARMAPLVLRPAERLYPRVRCLSLERTYVTEDFVAALFAWPDTDRAAEQLRDSLRYPEIILITPGARDTARLAALGVVSAPDDEVVLLTVRGIALAFRQMEADQRASDRSGGRWQDTAKLALRRLAALQKASAAESLPTEPETRKIARNFVPIDVAAMGAEIDPEKEIPVLKRRRSSALKMLTTEVGRVRAELLALKRRAEETRKDLLQMQELLPSEPAATATVDATPQP